MVTPKDAARILRCAAERGITLYLDGGWGVDALLAEQTRPHEDIDLFVEAHRKDAFCALLRSMGFAPVAKAYTTPSHTAWRDEAGCEVDLHVFAFAPSGEVLFEGERYPAGIFGAVGWIGEVAVRCIPAQEQILFHIGYEHDDNDIHDVRLLCSRFSLPLPEQYACVSDPTEHPDL